MKFPNVSNNVQTQRHFLFILFMQCSGSLDKSEQYIWVKLLLETRGTETSPVGRAKHISGQSPVPAAVPGDRNAVRIPARRMIKSQIWK